MGDRVRVISSEILSEAWGVLKRSVFDYRRLDGTWEQQTRETYDRGNGAAVLPHDPSRGTVLLVRQFRFPAYMVGHAEPLLEACAGLLDRDDPETCARREAEEELGYGIHDLEVVSMPFMSPGSVTERLACFVARYSREDRISGGGGHPGEGEDIEVVEMPLEEAYRAISDGRVVDAKTILLIQHLVIRRAGE